MEEKAVLLSTASKKPSKKKRNSSAARRPAPTPSPGRGPIRRGSNGAGSGGEKRASSRGRKHKKSSSGSGPSLLAASQQSSAAPVRAPPASSTAKNVATASSSAKTSKTTNQSAISNKVMPPPNNMPPPAAKTPTGGADPRHRGSSIHHFASGNIASPVPFQAASMDALIDAYSSNDTKGFNPEEEEGGPDDGGPAVVLGVATPDMKREAKVDPTRRRGASGNREDEIATGVKHPTSNTSKDDLPSSVPAARPPPPRRGTLKKGSSFRWISKPLVTFFSPAVTEDHRLLLAGIRLKIGAVIKLDRSTGKVVPSGMLEPVGGGSRAGDLGWSEKTTDANVFMVVNIAPDAVEASANLPFRGNVAPKKPDPSVANPRVRAIAGYAGDPESGDLSFDEGDEITVWEEDASGWFYGECKGKRGLFPVNFTSPIIRARSRPGSRGRGRNKSKS